MKTMSVVTTSVVTTSMVTMSMVTTSVVTTSMVTMSMVGLELYLEVWAISFPAAGREEEALSLLAMDSGEVFPAPSVSCDHPLPCSLMCGQFASLALLRFWALAGIYLH